VNIPPPPATPPAPPLPAIPPPLPINYLTCPTCRQVDMVQKVSAIYSGGNFTTSQRGVTVGLGIPLSSSAPMSAFGLGAVTSSRGTSQSQLSALLAPPRIPPGRGPARRITGVLLVSFGLFELAFALFSSEEVLVRVLSAFWGAAMFVVAVVVFRAARSYPATLQKAQVAAQRWGNSYFCLRDETVFDPWSGKAAPLSSFGKFLET
jgi:hypothetical protein